MATKTGNVKKSPLTPPRRKILKNEGNRNKKNHVRIIKRENSKKRKSIFLIIQTLLAINK